MVYAYMRQIAERDGLSRQQQSILSYSLGQDIAIDREVMEHSNINHSIDDRKKFEEFIHSLNSGDTILIHSLLILSSRIDEIVKVINCMLSHKVDLHISTSGTLINRDSKITDIFPLLNSLNEKQKAKKGQLGRPKGSRSTSKFDSMQSQIITLLRDKMTVSAIARELDVSRSSLKDYIESREIRKFIDKSWIEISQSDSETDEHINSTLLICPFDKTDKKED